MLKKKKRANKIKNNNHKKIKHKLKAVPHYYK